MPNLNVAYQLGYFTNKNDGWRGTNSENNKSLVGFLKWDLGEDDGLMFATSRRNASCASS